MTTNYKDIDKIVVYITDGEKYTPDELNHIIDGTINAGVSFWYKHRSAFGVDELFKYIIESFSMSQDKIYEMLKFLFELFDYDSTAIGDLTWIMDNIDKKIIDLLWKKHYLNNNINTHFFLINTQQLNSNQLDEVYDELINTHQLNDLDINNALNKIRMHPNLSTKRYNEFVSDAIHVDNIMALEALATHNKMNDDVLLMYLQYIKNHTSRSNYLWIVRNILENKKTNIDKIDNSIIFEILKNNKHIPETCLSAIAEFVHKSNDDMLKIELYNITQNEKDLPENIKSVFLI